MTRTSPVIGELTTSDERHVRGLQQRLAEAEAINQALLSGQIDAVVDATKGTPALLAKALALKQREERFREQAALLDIADEAIMVKGSFTNPPTVMAADNPTLNCVI